MKRTVNYAKIAPKDSFLGRYLAYNSGTESAVAYDFWCGLWLLSLVAGRECFVDRPRAPVYFNIYAILCAESGTTRKSSAVGVANKVAHEYNQRLAAEDRYWLVENKSTTEHLLQHMSNQSLEHDAARVAVTVSELVTFLGREKYSLTMPGTLTDLYDCPTERFGGGTVTRGSFFLRNVYVSFLAASTPSWLIRAINPDVIEGGFTSRCMFVVAETRKAKIAWPERDRGSDDGRARSELVTELYALRQDIVATISRIGINETAKRLFSRWYGQRLEHRDAFQSSFESREDAHVLKIAGLLAINDKSYVIQALHVRNALAIVSEIKTFGASMFAGAGSRSKLIIALDVLRDRLLSSGSDPLSRQDIGQALRKYINKETVDTMLSVMVELGVAQHFELKQQGAGRPRSVYRATNALAGKTTMASIIDAMEK